MDGWEGVHLRVLSSTGISNSNESRVATTPWIKLPGVTVTRGPANGKSSMSKTVITRHNNIR